MGVSTSEFKKIYRSWAGKALTEWVKGSLKIRDIRMEYGQVCTTGHKDRYYE
jgi:hypothetical protein